MIHKSNVVRLEKLILQTIKNQFLVNIMRYLDEQAIKDIATGAALLGAGGGGDPTIGMLMALNAVKKHGPVALITAEECLADGFYASVAGMGAPSVIVEKIPNGNEFVQAALLLEKHLGKKLHGVFPIEIGGINSMMPLVVAAQLGIPLVDCDGMGRAFPELQMVTFHLNGISSTPMTLCDEKNNRTILETINTKTSEHLARVLVIQMGGSAAACLYPHNGQQLNQSSVKGTLTWAEKIGKTIRESHNKENRLEILLNTLDGYHLFSGKIIDISNITKSGFNFGTIKIEGLNQFKGKLLYVEFQNENLIATIDNKPIACTPDLISLINLETLQPFTTESLKYGRRVHAIGLKADPQWRTEAGLKTAGPGYFGYKIDYKPIEDLVKEHE